MYHHVVISLFIFLISTEDSMQTYPEVQEIYAESRTIHVPLEWNGTCKTNKTINAESRTIHAPLEWKEKCKTNKTINAETRTIHVPLEWN